MRTGNKPKSPESSLGKHVASSSDIEDKKADAWHYYRKLVVDLDDPILNWVEREMIWQIGEKLYGTRNADKGNSSHIAKVGR